MLYSLIRWLVRIFMLMLGLKAEGVQNIPAGGPVILAANHVSNWDPVVVAVSTRRPIHFIAKEELFRNFFFGSLLTALNAFPVKRGTADRKAIHTALTLLGEGKVLGIFPEGERNKSGEDLKAQNGVALIALKSKATVVPVACVGTNRWLPVGWFKPLRVTFGSPLELEEYRDRKVSSANMQALSGIIMNSIHSLSHTKV